MDVQSRQVAYIVKTTDLLHKRYVEQEGWSPNYVVADWGEKLSRVNIIGTIVDASNNQLLLDDSFGTLPLRTFDEQLLLDQFKVGDVVLVIGKIRVYNDEYYIAAEQLQYVEPTFLEVRRFHLSLLEKQRDSVALEDHEDELSAMEESHDDALDAKDPIVEKIDHMDTGDGVAVDVVVMEFNDQDAARKSVEKLLMNGDIYEIKPGVVKVL